MTGCLNDASWELRLHSNPGGSMCNFMEGASKLPLYVDQSLKLSSGY